MNTNIQEAMQVIRRYAPSFRPKVGIILGSGLGEIAELITNRITIPYQAIPGLHAGAVSGHASLLEMGLLENTPVACLKGRLHLYEGATYDALRIYVRMIKALGAHTLIVTGAAGSMRPEVRAGEVVVVTDHINFHPGNPLLGPNDETIGPRFVSMEDAYDNNLRDIFIKVSQKINIPVHEGIYISVLGPSFETPAEIRMFKQWGADVIGMSVVPEVILARHCGLHVLGLTAITNLAVGMSHEKVTHEVTLHNAEVGGRKLTKLIPAFVKELNNYEY